jgi:hypothetical protein
MSVLWSNFPIWNGIMTVMKLAMALLEPNNYRRPSHNCSLGAPELAMKL